MTGSTTRVIRALGTTVTVDLGDLDPADFDSAWARCLESGGRNTAGEPHVGPNSTMSALTQSITRALIERRRGELLMLHAGAVANPVTGASLVYVAPGGTGKTTLSTRLGQDYAYLTDEAVGIEPGTWRILPYEKPLSTRTPEGGYPKREVSPDSLHLRTIGVDAHVAALVVLRRDSNRTNPQIRRMDLLTAISTLVPETSSLSMLPRPLHLVADLYGALDGFWLVEYSEAASLEDWVSERLGETT